jgi:hypothetical protein
MDAELKLLSTPATNSSSRPKLGYFFWNARIEQNGSVTLMPSNVHAVY